MFRQLIKKIVSGGQTGVDRAALDLAIEMSIPCGGWCPKGRWAEDGMIPDCYLNMRETPSEKPEQRTEWNVRDSDGTLVIVNALPTGGTLYTIEMAKLYDKPCFLFNVNAGQDVKEVIEWIKNNNISVLNVAGSRASQAIGMYDFAREFLAKLTDIN